MLASGPQPKLDLDQTRGGNDASDPREFRRRSLPMTTTPSHFQQLLQAAAAQPEPQQLLFVFAAAELPADATPAQRARYEAGAGGALEPLACVDKAPADLTTFGDLVTESRQASPPWQVAFIGGLSGKSGRPPTTRQIDDALREMVDAVRSGRIGGYLALDTEGEPLTFS
jgi:hypothetical protein